MEQHKPDLRDDAVPPVSGTGPDTTPDAARVDPRPTDGGNAAGAPASRLERIVPLEPSAATARRRMSVHGQAQIRRPPSEREQARRRLLLVWTKGLLPIGALLLLGSIAAWPEINRWMNASRSAYHQLAGVNIDTGKMLGARYRGLDAHGRPYMITADEARQTGPDHIDLVRPIADSLTQSGTWIMIRSRNGVYMPHTQILDMFDHVTLYRDDGTIMDGPTAVMDVKRGVVVSDDWVHAEGPFGVLDAQGDVMAQHDGIVQFRGPARMILNDDHTAHPLASPNAAGTPTAGAAPAPGAISNETPASRSNTR